MFTFRAGLAWRRRSATPCSTWSGRRTAVGTSQIKRGWWPSSPASLRPGGRLVFQELFAGPGGDLLYSVPWAREPSTRFLAPPESVGALLYAAGFTELARVPDELAASPSSVTRSTSLALQVHGAEAALVAETSQRNRVERRVLGYRGAVLRGTHDAVSITAGDATPVCGASPLAAAGRRAGPSPPA